MERIVEQRLSPQYVSVHATDLAVRARLLGNDKRDDVLARIKYFTENGIQIHAQVVLCPGINDGDVLRKTVYDLAGFHPGLVSTTIVPLGITDHHTEKDKLTLVSDDWCREVIEQVTPWQEEFKRNFGFTFAFLVMRFIFPVNQYRRKAITVIPHKSKTGRDGPFVSRRFRRTLKRKKPKPGKRLRGTEPQERSSFRFFAMRSAEMNAKLGFQSLSAIPGDR